MLYPAELRGHARKINRLRGPAAAVADRAAAAGKAGEAGEPIPRLYSAHRGRRHVGPWRSAATRFGALYVGLKTSASNRLAALAARFGRRVLRSASLRSRSRHGSGRELRQRPRSRNDANRSSPEPMKAPGRRRGCLLARHGRCARPTDAPVFGIDAGLRPCVPRRGVMLPAGDRRPSVGFAAAPERSPRLPFVASDAPLGGRGGAGAPVLACGVRATARHRRRTWSGTAMGPVRGRSSLVLQAFELSRGLAVRPRRLRPAPLRRRCREPRPERDGPAATHSQGLPPGGGRAIFARGNVRAVTTRTVAYGAFKGSRTRSTRSDQGAP